MSVSFFAEFSDGSRFAVVYDAKERRTYLQTTSGGRMLVPYYVGDSGFVKFDFDYTPEKNLRSTDVYDNRARFSKALSLLTPPAKPAEPIPRSEPDTKLHLLPRQPGESRLARLQRSVGVWELQARVERQREIRNQVAQADAPDAAKARAERSNNNQLATRWSRQRPEPVPPQIPPKEVMAEAARWRKRKMEQES